MIATRIMKCLIGATNLYLCSGTMDEEYLRRVKNTLVVILKERNHREAVALLGLGVRWDPEPVETNDWYERDNLWHLSVYLPAEAYARIDHQSFSSAEDSVLPVLNEIGRPRGDRFISLRFCPELVDQLSFSQQQLLDWLSDGLSKSGVPQVVQ